MNAVKKLYFEERESTFADNLQKLMRGNGVTEAELARQTKIPQPTLHKILTGKTVDPRGSTLSIIANYFSVSIDELYVGVHIDHKHIPAPETQSIPIITWKDCVKGERFTSELTPTNWSSWLTTEFIGPSAFALESKPSMESRFPPHTIFVIAPEITPEDGDLVVVYYPNTNEATLREFSLDGPTRLLLPITMNAELTSLTENIEVFGVVVQTRLNYKKLHKN